MARKLLILTGLFLLVSAMISGCNRTDKKATEMSGLKSFNKYC